MANVFSNATGERTIFPHHDVIGWGEYNGHGRVPVLWHRALRRWLHARELECLNYEEQAYMLWSMEDPHWGLPWNYGVKHCVPINLPIYADPDGKLKLRLRYLNNEIEIVGNLANEHHWLLYPDGSKEELIWRGQKWELISSSYYKEM